MKTETPYFLLADDDRDDRDLFVEALHSIDDSITCYLAAEGNEVFTLLNSPDTHTPKLIFLDINMPGMNGWECLKELKAHQQYRAIPVVMYSTSSHRREIGIALEQGAFCYFTKPSNYSDLKKALAVFVNLSGDELLQALRHHAGFHCP